MIGVLHEFLYAVRSYRRSFGITISTVIILALSMGANATVFSTARQVFYRTPPHVDQPGQLYRLAVDHRSAGGELRPRLSYPEVDALRRALTGHTQVTANGRSERAVTTIRRANAYLAEAHARVTPVLPNYFRVLGAPMLGGSFEALATDPSTARIVLVSHGFWSRHMGASPFSPDFTVAIEGQVYTVIGTLPAGFSGTDARESDIWVPAGIWEHAAELRRADSYLFSALVRISPQATLTVALANGSRALAEARGTPLDTVPLIGQSLATARWDDSSEAAFILALIGGASLAVLLLGCISTANLLLIRSMQRHKDLVIRHALGMSRRLAVQLVMVDHTAFVLGCAVLASSLAVAFGDVLRRSLFPAVPSSINLADKVWIACIVSLLVLPAVSFLPIKRFARLDRGGAFRVATMDNENSGTLMQRGLTVVQVALSFALLVGATLFVISLWNARSERLGIDPRGVLYVQIAPARSHQGLDAAGPAIEGIGAMPGVRHAAVGSALPFAGLTMVPVRVPGRTIPETAGGGPYVNVITPSYFQTVGTPLLRGRMFVPEDRDGAPQVAIVNETMARLLWPDEDALGQCIHPSAYAVPCHRVVGVAADSRLRELREAQAMQYYLPAAQRPDLLMQPFIVVKTEPTNGATIEQLLREVRARTHGVDIPRFGALEDHLNRQVRTLRIGGGVLAAFGMLALAVALTGVYAVVSLAASRRTKEVCVRMAVGATSRHIVLLLLREAVALGTLGVVVGIILVIAMARSLAPFLFKVHAMNPAVLSVSGCIIMLAVILASLYPAWRVSRTSPRTILG